MPTALITYENQTYEWDSDITVAEDSVIAAATGLHFGKWIDALSDPNDDNFVASLQALLWVLKSRKGETCDLRSLNFKIGELSRIVNEAMRSLLETAETESPKAPTSKKTAV